MKELLQEILDAGQEATLPLDMSDWYCGTAACLCGDVGISRSVSDSIDAIIDAASGFSDELDVASELVFGSESMAASIYSIHSGHRHHCALESGVFSLEELNHPHLTTDHNSREIAHDYVRLVMEKIK